LVSSRSDLGLSFQLEELAQFNVGEQVLVAGRGCLRCGS
jgi:hypothetical protein